MASELGRPIDELEVVEDQFFSTVLNLNGEFQIADTVYKITKNHVYSVSHTNSHYLNSISLRDDAHNALNRKTSLDPLVTVFEIKRSDLELMDKTDFLRRKSECEAYLNDRRRVKGQAWFTNWRVYMSATTELEFQRKGWGRWWRTNANWIKLDADYSITQTTKFGNVEPSLQPPPITKSGKFSKTKYRASEIKHNLTWGVAFPLSASISVNGWINSSYEGYNSEFNSDSKSCSTRLYRR